MSNTIVYVAGKSQQVPEYSGAVIDQPTLEQALAEHSKRIALDAVQAQQAVDERALSGLATVQATVLGLEQRQDLLSRQLRDASLLQVSAADVAEEAKGKAEAATAAVAAFPATDVQSVARLASDVQQYGLRTINQAAEAQEQIVLLAADTVEQVSTLRTEVVGLQGTSTETVADIQQASQAAVSDAITRVDEALATVPEQTRQTILNVLGEVEFLVGGQLDPEDRYTWQWRWARLKDPSTITRVDPCPVYVGWRGQSARSSPPVGGNGGTGAQLAGALVDQEIRVSGVDTELKFQYLNLPIDIRGDLVATFKLTLLSNRNIFRTFTLWVSAPDVGALAEAEHTEAGEFSSGGFSALVDYTWIIHRLPGGELRLQMRLNSNTPIRVQGGIASVTSHL